MTAYRDKSMQCPRCGKPLVQYEDRDKWRCKNCYGALVGGEQLAVEIGELAARVLADDADPTRPAIHPCPICAFPMTPYTIGTGKQAIEVDRCVEHEVVWFDHGEIGKTRDTIPPPDDDAPLLTNTLAFIGQLREQERALRAGELDDIPPEVPAPIAPGEWEKRAMCADGGCNGVIGPGGTCSVCGRAAAPAAAT
jgi:hypothetical protein